MQNEQTHQRICGGTHILHCIYSNIASNPGCSKTKENCFTSCKFNIEFMIQQKLTRTTRTLKSLGSVGGVCNFQSVNHFQVEIQQKHLWHGTFHPGWLRFQDLIISTWNKPQWVFPAIPYRNLNTHLLVGGLTPPPLCTLGLLANI